MTWQIQEAKNKLSEVVDTSLTNGPQIISRRGRNTAVLISYDEYQKLTKPSKNLKELLHRSGYYDLNLSRDKSPTGRASDQLT